MKINADLLKKQAEVYGIKISYKTLPDGLHGEASADNMTITLDPGLLDNPRQHTCVLAEEIGHILYPARPGHTRYHSKGFYRNKNCSMIKHTVAQDERKARDWATNVLLGHVDICRIKESGARDANELAGYFDTETWFMAHRIGYLRRKEREAGRKVKWRDFIRRD